MTVTAPARPEPRRGLPAALRAAVALVAAVTVIVVGLAGVIASPASARPLSGPETGVGAFGPAAGQVVGAHQPVLAGQRRARAPSYDRTAVGSAVAAETEPTGVLQAGEGGSYADLQSRGVVGDQLTPHHMPQAAAGYTGYGEGGALSMEQGEHVQTRTYGFSGAQTLKADADLGFRDVLAKDVWDVRSIVGSRYNSGLLDLLDYYRSSFPGLMDKGGGL